VARALEHRRGRQLRIVHGPVAGCAGAATSALVHDIDAARCGVPVGRPVEGTRAYVLDRDLRPVPTGMPGELCLGGEGLGHTRPNPATADRFVPDPFSPRPGAGMYRTGDLARLLPDGDIEYLGRTTDRAEIAGVRTETAVIRAAITSHPAIADAHVAARGEPLGDQGLVAYVVPAAGTAPDAATLREYAATTLPRYLVPDVVVPLPALPSTDDGRVDRSALHAARGTADSPAAETAGAPVPDGLSTATERAVAEEWRAVIGQSPPDREAKFLEAGGDSVLLVLFAERLRERFGGRAPTVVELFEYATVAQIAALVDSRAVSNPGEAG
jgi:hypothetical protein